MEDQQQVITRVSNYPVVKDAWSKMSEVYQRGKDGSRMIRFCGGIAETSATFAYRASLPILERLPVEMVNGYAVAKMESLEESYPVIVKPTEEVVDAVKTYSATKIDEAKDYSNSKINRLAEVTGVVTVLGLAETAVERFLPDVQDEEPEADDMPSSQVQIVEPAPSSGVVNRAFVLGGKVKRRAYNQAMAKVGTLQRRSEEAMSKLVHTIDLIDFAKKSLSDTSYEGVKEKVTSVYEEITREGEIEPLPASATLERKAIVSARILTRRLHTTIQSISKLAYALPSKTRMAVTNACNSAENMYQTLTNSDLLSSHRNRFLDQLKTNLDTLRTEVHAIGLRLLDVAQGVVQSSSLRSLTGPSHKQLGDMEVPTPFSETINDDNDEDDDDDEEEDDDDNEEDDDEEEDDDDDHSSDPEFKDDTDDSLLNSAKESIN